MTKIKQEAKIEFERQLDPETSEYECFFHYTDELLFAAGFEKGYEFASKNQNDISEESMITGI